VLSNKMLGISICYLLYLIEGAKMSSWSQKIKQSPHLRWVILVNIMLGSFMATLDSSIVNVALPTISQEFHIDLSTVQWLVTSYLLAICSFLPVFGRLADLWGRKNIFSTGILLFTLGSALCGLAGNIWFLVAMRVVQAIGASMLMSSNQAIIVSSFPLQERGRALGLSGTVVALGSLTGPVLGGFLVSWAGWRSIFYVNVPIGIVAYLAARLILQADTETRKISFDWRGSVFFTLGLFGTLFAVNNAHDFGWTSPTIFVSFILGIGLLVAFVYTQRRVAEPLIDFNIYRNRAFMFGNFSAFLNFFANYANTILMPFYLQHVLNYSTSRVGLTMAFFPICMAIVAPISGYASDKMGPLFLTTGGLLVKVGGFLYLLTVTVHSAFWQIVPGLVLLGVGTGMFQSPNNSSVMSAVRSDQIGIVNGLNALARNIGMILGASLSVLLFENRQTAFLTGIPQPTGDQWSDAFVAAFHVVMAVAAGITLLSAIISFNRKNYITKSQSM